MERTVVIGGVLVSASLLVAVLLNAYASRDSGRIGMPRSAEQEVGRPESAPGATLPSILPDFESIRFHVREAETKTVPPADIGARAPVKEPH
jgi:hypothetical protein